jgi:hypothetical protein
MLFLVTGENIDPGYLLPPDQAMNIIEQALIPSFQMLAQDPRVKGGVFPGERDGAFILEMDSLEDVDRFMNGLPMFGLIRWSVKALVPFGTFSSLLPEYVQNVRQMLQQGAASSGGQTS